MSTTENKGNKKASKIRAYIALGLVIIALIVFGWRWYKEYTSYYSTDDAYIDADRVAVSSKILGRITNIYADEGDSAKIGQLLVVLDSSDLSAQKLQAKAALDQASSSIAQSKARYELDQKTELVQEIGLGRAKEDLDRAVAQYEGKVIAKEQYDHAKKSYESAQAVLDAAKAQLEVSKAQITFAESNTKTAASQIGILETSLKNTRIFAPASGRIAKRWLLPGDVVQPGQAVFTITRDSLFYVMAYFEETKVSGIQNGKKAELTVDAYPDVKFTGTVINVGSNTAAQFSLIPPNNASGNFTKVTQRIPVKISLDGQKNDKRSSPVRFTAGMSVLVKIIK
ncbi:MAG: HlyD family secretion protein [Bacteroidetes bacterium]|nr:HlyD family secretion protein [Bacteroidota bacterium]